jgi:hypothetical protein
MLRIPQQSIREKIRPRISMMPIPMPTPITMLMWFFRVSTNLLTQPWNTYSKITLKMYSGREFRSLRMWHHCNGCAVPTKTVSHPKRSESSTTLTVRTSDLILYSGFQFYGTLFRLAVVLLDRLTIKIKEQWFSGASETAHPTTCHIPADLNTQHYNSGISLTFVQLLWTP